MTVKGKYTKAPAPRGFDLHEAHKHAEAGVANGSFPEAAVRDALSDLVNKIDFAAFSECLSNALQRYGAELEHDGKQPPAADALEMAKQTAETIRHLRRRLEFLPQYVERAVAGARAKRSTEPLGTLTERIDRDLKELWMLIGMAQRELVEAGKDGRKSLWHRDWLLHDIAQEIVRQSRRCGKERAAGVAANVLRAVGFDVADDPREARRIVLKVEKQRREN